MRFSFVVVQDEIQARFQAQIHVLQTEVEERDQLISQLQLQLQTLGVQPVSPVPPEEPQSDREEQTSSVESDEEDDDDSRTLRYFAVSSLSHHGDMFTDESFDQGPVNNV